MSTGLNVTWAPLWHVGFWWWDAPKGMQVAILDIESAFKIIPTRPEDWNKLAVLIDGLIHFDF